MNASGDAAAVPVWQAFPSGEIPGHLFRFDLPIGVCMTDEVGCRYRHLGGGRFECEKAPTLFEGSTRGEVEHAAFQHGIEAELVPEPEPSPPWRRRVAMVRMTRTLVEALCRAAGVPVSEASLQSIDEADRKHMASRVG